MSTCGEESSGDSWDYNYDSDGLRVYGDGERRRRPPPPPSNAIVSNPQAVLAKVFGMEDSKDLTLVAGVRGAGAEVKCHKVIFAAQSPVLAAMVSPDNGMLESQTGRVKMTGSSEAGLKLLVRYLYGLDIRCSLELTCQVAVELFKAAHLYELTGLEGVLQGFILGKGLHVHSLDWYAPDAILELYFHVKNIDGVVMEEFRDNLLRIMSRISEDLRACKRFKGLKKKEAEALLWKIVEVKGADEGSGLGGRGKKRNYDSIYSFM